jgi:RHS repeat-associated protein
MTYTYDSENHMTSATGNGKVVTMVYDAFGNRVSKTVNGVTTKYLVEDDVNPTGLPQVLEEVQNGAAVRTYTYGLQRISEAQSINGTWTPSFYGYDGAGSVRQLTNSTGQVTDEYEYDAFGNSFTKQGTTPNNFMYRGEQYDSDLGLYYLRARYYNPMTGRFLSRDPEDGNPTDPASLHKYLYAGGDPVNAMDPTGRDLFDTALVEGGSALTSIGAGISILGGTPAQVTAWAATIEQYIGIAYLTAQDILAVISDIAVTRGVVKTLFCGTGGFLLAKYLGEKGATDNERLTVGLAFTYVCGGAVPLPGPNF